MELKGKARSYYEDMLSIFFASLALLLSLSNNLLGIPTGFGMTIDLSAVPVFLSLFLLSYKHSIKTLIFFTISLVFLSPSGFVGAIMKFTATLPLIIIPYIFQSYRTNKLISIFMFLSSALMLIISFALLAHLYTFNSFATSLLLFLFSFSLVFFVSDVKFKFSFNSYFLFLIGILTRGVIMTIANIYFAAPLFFKISPEELINSVESLGLPFVGRASIFSIILFWNFVQSVIDISVAYLIFSNKFLKKHFK